MTPVQAVAEAFLLLLGIVGPVALLLLIAAHIVESPRSPMSSLDPILAATTVPQGARRIPADFRYDPADPLVVRLAFYPSPKLEIEWTLGRDLLRDGQFAPSGDGDVQVNPLRGGLDIGLTIRGAEFRLPRRDVEIFLQGSYDLVPDGAEVSDAAMDAGLAQLLDADGVR